MQDLARLLERAAAADEAAYRELYRCYRGAVVRVGAAFGALDADEVEDVVQETFVRAFKYVARLQQPEAFEAWLLSIARNRALTALERKSNVTRLGDRLAGEGQEPATLVPPALQREAAEQVVRDVIARLPEGPEKETARQFYVEGTFNARELAEREGVGKSAITMRLERFRSRVKRVLARRLLEVKWDI